MPNKLLEASAGSRQNPVIQIIGSTDARGEYVTERQATTWDFLATLYRHLGIDDDDVQLRNFAERIVPIMQGGKAIPELVYG